jgi:type VI secretion system protein ImpJ
MFLRPQHFQQQERYFEFVAHARASAVSSHAWGFEWLVLDQDAL